MSEDSVKSASNAMMGVRKWADVMMQYHEILKIVNPRRLKVT